MGEDFRAIIDLVNKIHKFEQSTSCAFRTTLPRIVAVGSQSSGKSSVLDALVGSSILPRGIGTVTKCPVTIQILHTPNPEEEGIEIRDAPDLGRIRSEKCVRKWISARMENGGGCVRDEPVLIQVYKTNFVSLTIVDLPGIKKLALPGESNDVEDLTLKLCQKYLTNESTIIMAISAANNDIMNSDGLKLAKQYDPTGERTIGVLTKLDIMDDGTDASKLLTGNYTGISTKLGMVGLVLQSQLGINENWTVKQQLEKEEKFLLEKYKNLAPKNGVRFLRKRLQDLLVKHVHSCLPAMKNELISFLQQCEELIESIPKVSNEAERIEFAYQLVQKLEKTLRREIGGCGENPDFHRLYGGEKIRTILTTKFAADMDSFAENAQSEVTDEMIQTAFRNSRGYSPLFTNPEAVVSTFAQQQILNLKVPALKCVDGVANEIMEIANGFFSNEKNKVGFLPALGEFLTSVVDTLLREKTAQARNILVGYIETQASIVFSLDKKLLAEMAEVKEMLERVLNTDEQDAYVNHSGSSSPESYAFEQGKRKTTFSSRPPINLPKRNKFAFSGRDDEIGDPTVPQLIRKMVQIYFKHVKKQVQDFVPKLVAQKLISPICSDEHGIIEKEILEKLKQKHADLFKLSEDVIEQLKKNMQKSHHLKDVISEIKKLQRSVKT